MKQELIFICTGKPLQWVNAAPPYFTKLNFTNTYLNLFSDKTNWHLVSSRIYGGNSDIRREFLAAKGATVTEIPLFPQKGCFFL